MAKWCSNHREMFHRFCFFLHQWLRLIPNLPSSPRSAISRIVCVQGFEEVSDASVHAETKERTDGDDAAETFSQSEARCQNQI